MSGLPFSVDMEGGFESTTPSRHGPYASTSQTQQPNFNLQPPPLRKTRTDFFGKHRDMLDQEQMDDDTPKQHNTPRRAEDPFDNLGNQSPKRPNREPPQGPPAGYGLHNIGSPDEISERKPKIIKEPGLFYDREHFKKFLGRFERTALAFKASDYDKALQIGWFIRSEELKVQLEAMDGYDEYDWTTLRKSMVDSWGELDNTILYTNQDLAQVTKDCIKNGGLKNIRKEEASQLFLSAFPTESQKSIKRALVSKGKLPKRKDGSDQPRLWEDAIKEAEFEIRVEEGGCFSATNFAESNYQMQKSLDQQKGGSQRRDRMLEELPTSKSVDKQVADMAQDLATLKQQLRSVLPTRYNNSGATQQDYSRNNERPSTPGNDRSEFLRPRERPSTPLYESQICFYCHRESHYTSRCPDVFKDEELGLVRREGKDWYLPNGQHIPWIPTRPIRSVVAAASADPKIMEAAEKLAKSRKVAFTGIPRPQTPPAFKTSAQLVDWEPPQLGAENFLKNQAITRADAQKGRRNMRIQEPEDDVELLQCQTVGS
ncbi:hypothetical protein PSTG_16482 [Puccinia striiformis f. sp. tritici PST-78]|uniref:CCHC-type domain-containing protein n=1 Tax=Puccinia striiformis f. sp. tritici PST-78 TaxID=1165861 RepID=A0A0L0USN3_9BASI|nr:hypothetical protein PSTG_16482 [Puccinia striiformis f. sp. tritici PST-78]